VVVAAAICHHYYEEVPKVRITVFFFFLFLFLFPFVYGGEGLAALSTFPDLVNQTLSLITLGRLMSALTTKYERLLG
jgi:hypothetical protein